MKYPIIFFLVIFRTLGGILRFCSIFYWLDNKVNPFSEFEPAWDIPTRVFFKLDMLKQNITGRRWKFGRNRWVEGIQKSYQNIDLPKGEIRPISVFDWKKDDISLFTDKLYLEQKPILFKNFLPNDEDYCEWDFDKFLNDFGNEDTVLTCPVFDGFRGKLKEIDVPGVYVQNTEDLLNRNPTLYKQMGLGGLVNSIAGNFLFSGITQLFAGKKSTGTWWHCAGGMNFFLMLNGSKKWTFIDPAYSPFVFPITEGKGKTMYYLSSVVDRSEVYKSSKSKLGAVDTANMDEYEQSEVTDLMRTMFDSCPKYEVILEPGDVLYNPAWWWHEVQNITEQSIGVATRWFDIKTPPLSNTVFDLGTRFNIPFFYGLMKKTFSQKIITKDKQIDISHFQDIPIEFFEDNTRVADFNSYKIMEEKVSEYYQRFGFDKATMSSRTKQNMS